MSTEETRIEPGYLVSVKTEIEGGREYSRRDLDAADETASEAARVTRWETTCVIEDPEEWERARVARGAALSAIWKVCVPSDFGLLCPVARKASLLKAIERARSLVDAHNASAKTTRIKLKVVRGLIVDEDRAVVHEDVSENVVAMEAAVEAGDVDTARAAAAKAQRLSGVLAASAADKVLAAVKAARARANEMAAAARKAAKASQEAAS